MATLSISKSAGHDDQLAIESLETHTFLFRTECSGLFAVLLKKIGDC
jgi:hypothetical protein